MSVEETKAGVGTNLLGEMSVVESKYKLSKGVKLLAVKGGSHTARGNTVTVTTEYSDSLGFDIVVSEDDKVVSHRFNHFRKVVAPQGRTDINKRTRDVPNVKRESVSTVPDLMEINVG